MSTSLTLDTTNFIRVLMNDPEEKEKIKAAFQAGPLKTTQPIGRHNAGDEINPRWCNLFVGTRREDQSLVKSQKTGRVVCNLRMQTQQSQDVLPERGAEGQPSQDQVAAALRTLGLDPQQVAAVAAAKPETLQDPPPAASSAATEATPAGIDDDIPF